MPPNLHIQRDQVLNHCRNDLSSEGKGLWQLGNEQQRSKVGALHAAGEDFVGQAPRQNWQKQAARHRDQLQDLQATRLSSLSDAEFGALKRLSQISKSQ